MKIDELGKIMTGIAKLHGDKSNQVEINAIQFDKDKSINVSSSSGTIDIITNIFFEGNEEDTEGAEK